MQQSTVPKSRLTQVQWLCLHLLWKSHQNLEVWIQRERNQSLELITQMVSLLESRLGGMREMIDPGAPSGFAQSLVLKIPID